MSMPVLSPDDLALMEMQSIEAQLPVQFRSGRVFRTLSVTCRVCRADIPSECFTGRISRLIESVADVDAIGICHCCRFASKYRFRLHDDQRVSMLAASGWIDCGPDRSFTTWLWSRLKHLGGAVLRFSIYFFGRKP